MDKINWKLLLELDKNPRASFNKLGKSARVSKEVAQYRFKQLVKKKILTGFYAFISISKLGFLTNKILIKYKSVTTDVQKQIVEFVLKHKSVAWAGSCEGAWDLIITTIADSTKEFTEFYTDFFGKFGKYFKQKEILFPIDDYILNDKYLSGGEMLYKKRLDFHEPLSHMDDIDLEIIRQISLNSRATFTEIGKKVKLSYWAVAQRYKKLIDGGMVIALKPRIDFRKLGFAYYHILIELSNEKRRKDLIMYYTQQKDCVMIMSHCGYYSLHLEFVMKPEDIKSVIVDLRERFGEDIMSYEPLLILEEYVMNLVR